MLRSGVARDDKSVIFRVSSGVHGSRADGNHPRWLRGHAVLMVSDSDPRGQKRGRRRRRPKRPAPESAVQVIASSKAPVDTSKPADIPLTPAEVAEMRIHFRFLKESRRLLDLKVNATEDLLLNGVREPTHRGVCQHLLAKVERHRVELAVARLDPAAAARLLEGIIRFSPDIAYLLLYLETLKNAERPDATAALSEALRRIDFSVVSHAHMRRVLDLIVELRGERDRPALLFSLLESRTFQEAFDKSTESLPEALAELVVPLRAAHAVIVRGAKNPADAASLGRGVAMLLRSNERVLRGLSSKARERLFDFGLELDGDGRKPELPGLEALLDALPKDDRASSDAAFRLAKWCLRGGLEKEARKLLKRLAEEHPNFRLPQRLLEALDGPRVGAIGLSERVSLGAPLERERFLNGMLVLRQIPVWVRLGTANDLDRYARAVDIARGLAVPGVASILASGSAGPSIPYLATPRLGRSGNEVLLRGGAKPTDVLAACGEIVRILSALADAGVKLPDARLRRFAVDDAGRVWLRDLVDAKRCPAETARPAHTELAREVVGELFTRTSDLVGLASVQEKIRTAADCVAMVRLLDEIG